MKTHLIQYYLIEFSLIFPIGGAKRITNTIGEFQLMFVVSKIAALTCAQVLKLIFILEPDFVTLKSKLLSDFLQSAAQVLSPHGEIHVALCGGQGGCSAMTLQEWKGSWTASMFAADHGLLLARTFPFDAQYRLSSHRYVIPPQHICVSSFF